jgi:hypothetical protein
MKKSDSPEMSKSCRVSVIDSAGIEHAVEVHADSLFEAAGLALSMPAKASCVSQAPSPLARIQVEVREPAAQHSRDTRSARRSLIFAYGGAVRRSRALNLRTYDSYYSSN